MSQTVQERRERQKQEQRRELIEVARQLVRDEGYEGLTIRKLAACAGYATMSVYSYFADKHAILTALAEDQFELLAHRLNRNVPADPIEALRQGMLDYVEFGLENPNEYRTVFMSGIEKNHDEFVELEARNPAMKCLMERVEAAIAAGRLHGDTRAIATLLWTAMHGAIALLITFPHYPFGESRAYALRVFDVALRGLSSDEVAPLGPTDPAKC